MSTDVKNSDPETRKLIRSHVMRGKNRERKPRQAKQQRATSWAVMIDPSQIQLAPLDQLLEMCHSFIPRTVGSDLSFTKFAVEIEPALFGDIRKFSAMVMNVMFPLAALIVFDKNDTSWFDLLSVDAAYLHINAFAAGAFIDKIVGQRTHTIKQEITLHFLKGVQLLRERLSTGDEDAKISNSTISVVLTLANTAHAAGEYETGRQHMVGLRKMVDLRGGLTSFRGNFGKKLLMEMLRCDIGIAFNSGSKPIFFNDYFLEPFVPYPDQKLWTIRNRTGTICSKSSSEDFLAKIDEDLGTAWRVMQRFCSLINLAAETHRMLSAELIMDTMASVMYRLLHMGFEIGSVDEAIRLGLLSFSYHVFVRWKDINLCNVRYPSFYRNCLFDLKLTDGFPSGTMLWLLMVARISIFAASDDARLKGSLQEHINMCQVKSWKEMRDILKSFMWIGLLLDKPGKDIFDSVSIL